MNILVDISHPAHVHLLKHAIRLWQQHGHKVLVTVKEIEIAKQLLESEQIAYTTIGGTKHDSLIGKALTQLHYNFLLWKLARCHRIEIGIGSSVTLAYVSKFCEMKSIFLDDDDDKVEPLIAKYVHPFCDTILSPEALKGNRTALQTLFYKGTHELAYLHPKRFVPNPKVLLDAGLKAGEPFFVMRFNAFKAHHDGQVYGLSLSQKLELVHTLEPHGKILITTERNIEPELLPYRMPVSPEKIHDLLFYASLFVGDSQTMTSEAATLGTPAFRCNTLVGELSCIEDLENTYGLTYGFLPAQFEEMLLKIKGLLEQGNLKQEWCQKRTCFLSEKIDVTAFLVDFVEQYQ